MQSMRSRRPPALTITFITVITIIFSPLARAESLTVSMTVGLTYFSVNGYTSPSSTVTLKESGAVIATTSAGVDGYYEITVLSTEGLHTYDMYAVDPASTASSTVTQTVSLTPGTTTTIDNLILPPTITISDDTLTVGEDAEAFGYGAPDSSIIVMIDSSTFLAVTTDILGSWTATLSTDSLSAATHEVNARNSVTGGYNSLDSTTLTLTLLASPSPSPSSTPGGSTSPTPGQAVASPTALPSPPPTPRLPWWLKLFDTNKDNHLSLTELKSIITAWVRNWTKTDNGTCDLNRDGICDLYDLSILLYYIER